MTRYPTRPCCKKFEALRTKVMAGIRAVQHLGVNTPRLVTMYYCFLSKGIPPELLVRLLNKKGGCPCGAKAGEDVRVESRRLYKSLHGKEAPI